MLGVGFRPLPDWTPTCTESESDARNARVGRRPHPGHFVAKSRSKDGKRHVHSQIEGALERAHFEATGYARRAHSFIDSDREALREADEIRRECEGIP